MKEIFEEYGTGNLVEFFHWTSPMENESLLLFLSEDSCITDNTISVNGISIQLNTNLYFYKENDKIKLWSLSPEFTKKFSYVSRNNTLAASGLPEGVNIEGLKSEDILILKNTWSKLKKYKQAWEMAPTPINEVEEFNSKLTFLKAIKDEVCNLEELGFTLQVTKPYWDFVEQEDLFDYTKEKSEIIEAMTDFNWNSYEPQEKDKHIYDITYSVYQKLKQWKSIPNKPEGEIFQNDFRVYYKSMQGEIYIQFVHYEKGDIISIFFTTEYAEYNPFY